MPVRPEELHRSLAAGRLARAYLLTGDEPLQRDECADAVRAAARAAGCAERSVHDLAVDAVDWDSFAAASASLSLFAARRLVEVRLKGGRLAADGARALVTWLEGGGEDVLLVTGERLERGVERAAWVRAIERCGLWVQVQPLGGRALERWIASRAKREGLSLSAEAVALLAELGEGNLLACAQQLAMLALSHRGASVDATLLAASAADSARFSAFELADAALAGDPRRVTRVLAALREEGAQPVLVQWALAREVRSLALLAEACAAGESPAQALARLRVWAQRRQPLQRAAQRLGPAASRRLLALAGLAERVCKGAAAGEPWQVIELLALALAGADVDRPVAALLT